ncbi:penicillin acylase family protein [Agromyces sp. MMS24-JH15]|uniref:penicillin acylase family protein n=1 Tax=Agromyces sp. MMS24-JH15 TaxID=3243765 RepID=UPI0037487EC5
MGEHRPGASELFRDALGVPHLRADDELALAEAQGYVTAIDRAWQIEVDRWRAEGRLAERIGRAGADWDRFARRVRLADTAERAYAALDDDDRAWVDAYVRGVNAGLPAGRAAAPEFAELDGVEAFAGHPVAASPWPAWAPLGVFLVAHVLFSPFPNLLWRFHVRRQLGDALVDAFTPGAPSGAGSNAWAIHGSRTASGAPILAGDPHRLLELPGVYQQVRLACPDYDVVGLAFPGVPGVQQFGHTGSAAWGITNAMAHGVDVFAERLREIDGRIEALGADGWEPVEAQVESIAVRGEGAATVRVLETARGPVVAGFEFADSGAAASEAADSDAAASDVPASGTAFSLRMPARVDADLGFAAFRPLLRARRADDVVAAFDRWVDPVNRVLAADASGTVLRWTAGCAPVRSVAERRLPLDAWADSTSPGIRMRQPAEPVAQFAVDANERPDREGHDLGYAYPAPTRARRIAELLEPVDAATPDDMAAIHADVLDARAVALLDRLRRALALRASSAGRTASPGTSTGAAALAATLLGWDGHRRANDPAAGAFAAWHSALVRRIAGHSALAPLHTPHGMGAVFDPWFSVAQRVGDALESLLEAPRLHIDADAELVAALEDASRDESVRARSIHAESIHADADMDASGTPAWGIRHRLVPLHVLAEVPGARAAGVRSVGLPGAGDTVCCTGSVPGVTDLAFRGSVARWVWDLGDRERSRWNVPFGASGVPGDPHFDDQLAAWARAETTAITTDWSRLRREGSPWNS